MCRGMKAQDYGCCIASNLRPQAQVCVSELDMSRMLKLAAMFQAGNTMDFGALDKKLRGKLPCHGMRYDTALKDSASMRLSKTINSPGKPSCLLTILKNCVSWSVISVL